MYICSKCSNSSEKSVRFCDQCGAPMIEVCQTVEYADEPVQPVVIEPQVIHQEPAKEIPSNPQFIPQEPKKESPKVSVNPPPSTASSTGKRIAGAALAAAGLGLGCFGLMLTGTMAGISGSEALAICFGFIGTPLSTVGLVLSSKAAKANPQGKKTGKVLGFIGLGLNALMVITGIAIVSSM